MSQLTLPECTATTGDFHHACVRYSYALVLVSARDLQLRLHASPSILLSANPWHAGLDNSHNSNSVGGDSRNRRPVNPISIDMPAGVQDIGAAQCPQAFSNRKSRGITSETGNLLCAMLRSFRELKANAMFRRSSFQTRRHTSSEAENNFRYSPP